MDKKKPDILHQGDVVGGKFEVLSKLGSGGFGQIYSAKPIQDDSATVALKIESSDINKSVLGMEVSILKRVKRYPWFPSYRGSGRAQDYSYVAMTLLGHNLAYLRKRQRQQCFSIATVCALGMQILSALECLHKLGVLHRDIKPSNCAIGLGKDSKQVYLIDFGLARMYRDSNGKHRQERQTTGFRGTARYASLNAHNHKDLGRRDDLWSFLYLLIELTNGSLPWRNVKDKSEVKALKEKYTPEYLVRKLPVGFSRLIRIVSRLEFADEPPYSYMHSILQQMFRESSGSSHVWEWESTDTDVSEVKLPRPKRGHGDGTTKHSPLRKGTSSRLDTNLSRDPGIGSSETRSPVPSPDCMPRGKLRSKSGSKPNLRYQNQNPSSSEVEALPSPSLTPTSDSEQQQQQQEQERQRQRQRQRHQLTQLESSQFVPKPPKSQPPTRQFTRRFIRKAANRESPVDSH